MNLKELKDLLDKSDKVVLRCLEIDELKVHLVDNTEILMEGEKK